MNIITYAPLLAQGMVTTLTAWIIAGTISLCIGICLGILSCRHLGKFPYQGIVQGYTFVAKGIPAYIQILIAYFVIPALLGVHVSGFTAATLALAFCSSGYITEMIRSGINTIPRGQWDAARVLGYPLKMTIYHIILPQVFANIFPMLCGEFEQLLKSTSILATIGVTELTRSGMNIISRELNPIPIYLIIALIYLSFSGILQLIIVFYEKHMYGNRS